MNDINSQKNEQCEMIILTTKENKEFLELISKLKNTDFESFKSKIINDITEIYKNEIKFLF